MSAVGVASALREQFGERLEDGRLDDQELAITIRRCGRSLLKSGAHIDFREYLEAIPNLESHRLSLDAAIDVSLRSTSNGSNIADSAVAELIGRYPRLESTIRDAAALSCALWDTDEANQAAAEGESRELPQQFGPPLSDGRLRYELVELLGSGSFAEVYRAIDHKLSEQGREAEVAIKVLRARLTGVVARRRMVEEAARARSVRHPSIVEVYDIDETPAGECYIVQELVLGGDLASWRESQIETLTPRDSARLVCSLARGVQAIHSQGLVHLDLKPANVLMSEDGVAKLTDFGIATWQTEAGDWSAPRGTAAFMSPEQFKGKVEATSPRADVYALGGILHWMLTGELPNGDTIQDVQATHDSGVLRGEALEQAVRTRAVDDDLAAICRRALDPDHDLRFDSASELADSLDLWIRRFPLAWRKPSPARRLKLFAARRPLLLSMQILAAVLLIVVILAVDSARHYSHVARAEAIEADANAKLLEIEQRWKLRAMELVREQLTMLATAQRTKVAGEALTSLWVLEWVYGPEILDAENGFADLWGTRIEVLERLLEERRREAGPSSHAVMQLEYVLAFWRLKDGDHEEAEALVDHGMNYWRERLDPGDPWIQDLDLIRLCARFDRFRADTIGKDYEGDTRKEAIAYERALRAEYVRLSSRSDGAPLAQVVLQRLNALYSPLMLDSEPWLEWAVGQEQLYGQAGWKH